MLCDAPVLAGKSILGDLMLRMHFQIPSDNPQVYKQELSWSRLDRLRIFKRVFFMECINDEFLTGIKKSSQQPIVTNQKSVRLTSDEYGSRSFIYDTKADLFSRLYISSASFIAVLCTSVCYLLFILSFSKNSRIVYPWMFFDSIFYVPCLSASQNAV